MPQRRERHQVPVYQAGSLIVTEEFEVFVDDDGAWLSPDAIRDWERKHLEALALFSAQDSRLGIEGLARTATNGRTTNTFELTGTAAA